MYASAKQAKISGRKGGGEQGGGDAEGGRKRQIKIFRMEDNTVFWPILGAEHMGFRLHCFLHEVGYRATTKRLMLQHSVHYLIMGLFLAFTKIFHF